MKRDAAHKKFEIVITHKIDRLFRNAQAMLQIVAEWQAQGVLYASVREEIDFTTPWGRLLLGILSLIAEWFVNNLRDETKKGLYGRFKDNLHNGPIPWGYCRGNCSTCTDPNGEGYCPRFGMADIHHEKHAVPHPVDSIAFRAAHELYRTGNYSDRDIAAFLNNFKVWVDDDTAIQVRSRGKPGQGPAPFTKDMITSVLQNVFYTGYVPFYGSKFDGERVIKYTAYRDLEKGRHAALISDTQYDRAMDVRKTRGKAPRGKGRAKNAGRGKDKPRRAARVYVLQGLLDCARCGEPLHAQAGGKNVRRHVCSTRLQRKGACDQPSTQADRLENELAERMASLSLPDTWQAETVGFLIAEAGLAALEAQRRDLEAHFAEVQRRYEHEEIGRQAYLYERRFFQKQMAALTAPDDLNLDHARALLTNFPALWQRMTPQERKEIAQSLLRVGIYDAGHVIEWHWYAPFQDLFRK